MKKVLFFTHNLSHGGAEKIVRFVHEYINSHDCGWESWLCIVYSDPDIESDVKNLIIMKHHSRKTDNKFSKGINVLKQIKEMRAIKKSLGIDVCVSFLSGADIINVLSGTGEKQIVSVRNEESRFVNNILQKEYRLISYRNCDRISAVSARAKVDLTSFFGIDPHKIIEIPNPVSRPQINQVDDRAFTDFVKDRFVIMNVARLFEAKSQLQLIKAFQKLLDELKQDSIYSKADAGSSSIAKSPVLVIVGDGPLRKDLENYIAINKLEDKVLLAGEKRNVASYLAAADLFVLSSRAEGMPNALLEAMACGLPCISTDCGAREILAPDTDPMYLTDSIEKGKYGILIPTCSNDPNDKNYLIMSKAIEMMLNDEEMRSRYSKLSKEALERYDKDHIGEEWIKLLNETGGNR
ncbi:glycosyltransferase [Butyrivibrio sp. MC2013]|uniref:glycosyltransferase n=1 Tax=Butyrivibrio sp. MC2013 TaxID=1280686 RepID=UPI00041E7512|nr:glycosyltransferase [Butyrivibrio sp. MC2013]